MPSKTYRAFISYNRADAAIAAALAASLARFARPWYRTRAMRVFLDKNSLATDPTLSGAIERGLAHSEWLILLASPSSAAAPWVRHEVAWWLEHRGVSNLIIARTAGTIAWEGVGGHDFDWAATTALPPGLRGSFSAEPIWADLEAAAATPHKSLANPVYRDGFLLVAARIHGVPKDRLWNIEQAEQRKRVAFAAGVVSLAALFAWGGYNQYAVSMDRKENLASIQLGAKAFSALSTDPRLAAQIALAGIALRPSGIAASALRSAAARLIGPLPPRFERELPGAVAVEFAPDGSRLAVLFADGRVLLLDAATGRPLEGIEALEPSTPSRVLAWGRGGRLASGGDAGLRLRGIDGAAGVSSPVLEIASSAVSALAFSVDGARLAVGHVDGLVEIVRSTDGVTLQRFATHRGPVRALAFANDGTRLASGDDDGEAVLWASGGATPLMRMRLPGAIVSVDFNREGSGALAERMLAVADTTGTLRVLDADAPASSTAASFTMRLGAEPGAGVAARFVTSGRCLARVNASGPVGVDATLGFEPLFALGVGAERGSATITVALADTRRFAVLNAAGRLAVYEQALCGDAEAVCAFAAPWLKTPMNMDLRARWIPAGLDLSRSVQQPPGAACRALIDANLPALPPGGLDGLSTIPR